MEKAESKPSYLIAQDWLAENIAQGTLPAGTRLTIAGVAQRLNVSRSPVVRAMENLVAAETLTQQGRAGYLVGPAPADAADRAQVMKFFTLPVILPDTSARQSGNGRWPILSPRSKTKFRLAPARSRKVLRACISP